jgi:hypothetical protein
VLTYWLDPFRIIFERQMCWRVCCTESSSPSAEYLSGVPLDSFDQRRGGSRLLGRATVPPGVTGGGYRYGSIGRLQQNSIQSPLRSSIDSSTYELLPRKKSGGDLEDDDFEMI